MPFAVQRTDPQPVTPHHSSRPSLWSGVKYAALTYLSSYAVVGAEARTAPAPTGPAAALPVPAASTLQHIPYGGGPIMTQPHLTTVFWNSDVRFQSTAQDFAKTAVTSAFVSSLGEFDPPGQTIVPGTYDGSMTLPNAPKGSTIDDSVIVRQLQALQANGGLPQGDGEHVFMVHMPPGVTVTAGSESSCQACTGDTCNAFCGYHSGYFDGSAASYYAVIADAECGDGSVCYGPAGTPDGSMTYTMGHELAEAITDPNDSNGWISGSTEIADACEDAGAGSFDGFTAPKLWSNCARACIQPGTESSAGCTSGAKGGLSGGAIAGIVVGSIVGVLVVLGGGTWFAKKKELCCFS